MCMRRSPVCEKGNRLDPHRAVGENFINKELAAAKYGGEPEKWSSS